MHGAGAHGKRPHQHQQLHNRHHGDRSGADHDAVATTAAPSSGVAVALSKPPEKHRKPAGGASGKKPRGSLREKRAAFSAESSGFAPMTYEEALASYASYQSPKLPVNQSSASFIDILEDKHAGIRLPDKPIVAVSPEAPTLPAPAQGDADDDDATGDCDPSDNVFTAEVDAACRAYLANPANWVSLKPMSAILSTGRTIKFRLFLRNGAVAVMKVPQKKFVLEPSSEIMAYETDRLMNFRRVPPTAWVSFPVKYLQAASASKRIDYADGFYSQWFQQFVLDYQQSAAALHKDKATGEKMLHVSLQLWMHDVHNADETALRPPEHHASLMDAGSTFPPDASNWTRAAIAELSDVSLFDFIIGNSDRWFGHNSFAYGGCGVAPAAGGRRASCTLPPPEKRISGPPAYAFIDQGSSFYRAGPPEENLYYGGAKDRPTSDQLCRLRRATAETIVALGKPAAADVDYLAQMVRRLPKGIFAIGSKYLVKAARTRVELLTQMITKCTEHHPREQVFFDFRLP